MSRAAGSVSEVSNRVSVALRLRLAVLGFLLGWVWCSIGSLLWIGVLAIAYAGLDEGLSKIKDETWAPIVFAAYFGCVAGNVAGSTVAPAAAGPDRRRFGLAINSLIGAVVGGILAAAVGAAAGWVVWRDSPQSVIVLKLPMYLGVPVGALVGWLVGMRVRRKQPAGVTAR